MKKNVTIFLFLLSTSLNINAFASVQTHSKAGKPTMKPLQIAPNGQTSSSVFLSPAKYIKQFSPAAFRFDTLNYIDTTNKPLPYSFLPSRIRTTDKNGNTFEDTIVSRAERYTATYSGYLDAVQIGMAISNLVSMSPDSLNQNALIVKVKSQTQPTGRVPFESLTAKTIDSTILTFTDLSGNPTDGSFFLLTIPLHHKKVPTNFFIELRPAIDFVNGFDIANQNFFAILNDSNFFDLHGNGVDINKVRGYFTLKYNDTSSVNILVDPQMNGFYGNYWMAAEITNTPAAVNDSKLSGNMLAQNYPNPFNPSTVISYSLEKSSKVSIKLYNALGLEVATILDANQPAGENQVSFSADNLPSGTYFYTMKAGTFTQTKRMVLAK